MHSDPVARGTLDTGIRIIRSRRMPIGTKVNECNAIFNVRK